jgi:hypothetical protein
MPTSPLKPTPPGATNGQAAPLRRPDAEAMFEEQRQALAGDYIEISRRVVEDLSNVVAKAQDPGVRAWPGRRPVSHPELSADRSVSLVARIVRSFYESGECITLEPSASCPARLVARGVGHREQFDA